MSRKTLYLLIICVLLIFIVWILVADAYYTYLNAAKIESAVEKTAPNIERAARVLCDPIENDTIPGITIPEEAKQRCRDLASLREAESGKASKIPCPSKYYQEDTYKVGCYRDGVIIKCLATSADLQNMTLL